MASQEPRRPPRPRRRRWHVLSRILIRLLAVNLIVVLVPIAGLEFARIYERQLLDGLERDMRNQSTLVRRFIEHELTQGTQLGAKHQASILTQAALDTRTRIRLIDRERGLVADSHRHGPPEGPEPGAPSWLGRTRRPDGADRWSVPTADVPPDVMQRFEVREALAGRASQYTRVSRQPPAVYLFLTEPLRLDGKVVGVVYVTRSTQPVLVELYRIRQGLLWVVGLAVGLSALLTLVLALSISRPLGRLSRAAGHIARGERDVRLPTGGGGEITELGESLSAMTEQLNARLKYISDFAADVAHEFKSPLTSIRGAAELLAEGAADEPEARARFLANIQLDAERLDRLVSRLLELSRIETSSEAVTTVDLSELVGRAIERSQTPEESICLEYESPIRTLPARRMDLETALLNLLDNALRFSPEGGRVTVRVVSPASGDEVAISVTDQGPGIPEAHRDRVFDRFFTTDPDGEGTGLGLAIVRSVAAAHGGTAEVSPSSGGGATITVRLPVPR